jgi:uncharacterized RDD family membrane protein YckC
MLAGELERPPSRPSRPPPSFPARVLRVGARQAQRAADLTGLDEAVEDALLRALESGAVERAIVQALDSEMSDRVWEHLLESEKVQLLIERIAEAPEIRAAMAAQGIGLVQDLGRQVTRVTRTLDNLIETVARRLLRRPARTAPAPQAGAVTRALAFVLDLLLLNGTVLLASGLIAVLVSAISPGDESLSAPALVLGASTWLALGAIYFLTFWALAGQTPAMRFMEIRLDLNGAPAIGLRRAARRLVGFVLAAIPFGLGFVGVVTNERRRGFQDRLADTEVVWAPRQAGAQARPAPA